MNRARSATRSGHQPQTIKPTYGVPLPQNRVSRTHLLGSKSTSHFLLKKLKLDPWQRVLDGDKRPVYSQEGFQLMQNKQNVDAVISDDFFTIKDEIISLDNDTQQSLLPPPIKAHIDHLVEQVDDLTLLLEEERLNHKQTRHRSEENLINQFRIQSEKYNDRINQIVVNHNNMLENLHSKHSQEIMEEQAKADARESYIQKEMDYVKSSFHTYKITLEKENEEKIHLKSEELMKKMRDQMNIKEEQLNRKINDQIMKERKNIAARQKMEIENIRKQHQKEVETIHKTFADTAYDRAKTESLSKELTSAKLDLDDYKERTILLSTKLKDLEIQHVQCMRELNEFRTRFDEKTKEIEKIYTDRIDSLNLQNADLRHLFMKKCAEVIDERNLTKHKIDEQVKLSKIQLRQPQTPALNIITSQSLLPTSSTDQQNRCHSALTAPNSSSLSFYNNSRTNFESDNVQQSAKLRRRLSDPITEEEQDIVRYYSSRAYNQNKKSKVSFENEHQLIGNTSLTESRENFDRSNAITPLDHDENDDIGVKLE
ncbi:unnamed protein product [Didymodactylos carnosus]|uniref:Uncharacterized protein n=1 Tax=Didymodactylos carnosus TaxID=1234261 RepID=A0A813VN17_9BILA|nr:unnamed protein product [Didymodactylos carnosus]CAF1192856.1 unnamed protein product [Didymodactylos carnosus]CAF3627305.1 unnamed protein product [Didymodactylos carnosus]CAF4003114.1 unnamed protein product [Didymodactylos carnosus]